MSSPRVLRVVVTRPARPPSKSAEVPTAAQDQAQLAEELRSLCRLHLAPYEVPQVFEFAGELPRSPLGKLLKRELRKPPPPAPAPAAVTVEGNGGAGSNGNGRHVPGGNGSVSGNGSASGNGHAEKEAE